MQKKRNEKKKSINNDHDCISLKIVLQISLQISTKSRNMPFKNVDIQMRMRSVVT